MTNNEHKRRQPYLTSLQVTAIIANAALYVAMGVLTYFGIFTPLIGVVRFWPAVVVPGVFSVLFGPLVGGLGAAIGIFASDMIITGNALLSLTVGVPSNFIGFFLLGYIARKQLALKKLTPVIVISALILIAGIYSILAYSETLTSSSTETLILFLGGVGGSFLLILLAAARWPKWRSYGAGSVVGLGVGSAIIGVGVTAYFGLPIYYMLLWFIWTFATEIPFLLLIGPPILKACYRAFPNLKPPSKESS